VAAVFFKRAVSVGVSFGKKTRQPRAFFGQETRHVLVLFGAGQVQLRMRGVYVPARNNGFARLKKFFAFL
jgi:hypothetical protein